MALMSFTDAQQRSAFLGSYGVEVIDSIGRVYIVNIPLSSIAPLSLDERVERIEAEPMPRPAMDVTPGQVNANAIYAGDGHIVHSSMVVRYNSLLNGAPDYYENAWRLLYGRRILVDHPEMKGIGRVESVYSDR